MPQPTALKPPSTARTAGKSDWTERRFRRQPFILLSFSSSKKAQKAQETQSYQRFQHIGRTVFNTSGTNAATLVSKGCGGYTLTFANRIAHSGSQGETGAFQRRVQRACGTAMRSCASLFRGVAAPLGCVIPLLFLSPHRWASRFWSAASLAHRKLSACSLVGTK